MVQEKFDKINIVGIGELGKELYDAFDKYGKSVYGTEVNPERIKELSQQGYNIGKQIQNSADVYVITVYTTQQVLNVLKEIKKEISTRNRPLISIESTLEPRTFAIIREIFNGEKCDVALFPHRYNPNDPDHHLFNLDRLLAGITEKGEERARLFYEQFMSTELIHVYSPEYVELAKSMENAYRFAEIVIAQHLRDICEKEGLDFKILRETMNTKWNIDIKEARDGCGGKCLPKDSKFMGDYFNSELFKMLISLNDDYIKRRIL